MKRLLLLSLFLFCLTSGEVWGQFLLPNAEQTFLDQNGAPLAGGKVYTYVPGTTTPKTTYVDSGLTTANTNPITLDAGGRAIIWGSGLYREIVQDINGNQQWDQITSVPPPIPSFLSNGSIGTGPVVLSSELTRAPNPGNLYVSPGGSDSNDCLTAVIMGGHGPCLTLQQTVNNALTKYDFGGNNLQINVASGTYNAGFVCAGPLPGGSTIQSQLGTFLVVAGNGSLTTDILDTTSGRVAAVLVEGGCQVRLTGLSVNSNQSNSRTVEAISGGYVQSSNDMQYGSGTQAVISAVNGGLFEALVAPTLTTGNVPTVLEVTNQGIMLFDSNFTVTVGGNPTYSGNGFAFVTNGGLLYTNGAIFSGSAVGPQGFALAGGIVNTGGVNATSYFPGSLPFQVSEGATYLAAPSPTLVSSTGLGGGGTVSFVVGSNAFAGGIVLNAGTSASAAGVVTVNLGIGLQQSQGLPICLASPSDAVGTGIWSSGSTAYANNASTTQLAIAWNTNGAILSNATGYVLNYVCRGN